MPTAVMEEKAALHAVLRLRGGIQIFRMALTKQGRIKCGVCLCLFCVGACERGSVCVIVCMGCVRVCVCLSVNLCAFEGECVWVCA
jgi:hypothetical protein